MIRVSVLAFASAFAVAGCAHQTSPNVYDPYAVGQAAPTQMGVVRASRPVEIMNDSPGGSGVGVALGGFAGALAGSQLGPQHYRHRGHKHHYTSAGSVLGTIGGAVAGAIVGGLFERELSRQTAIEYVVQMDDGRTISIVQGNQPIPPGQRVFVQVPDYGRARIVPATYRQ